MDTAATSAFPEGTLLTKVVGLLTRDLRGQETAAGLTGAEDGCV